MAKFKRMPVGTMARETASIASVAEAICELLDVRHVDDECAVNALIMLLWFWADAQSDPVEALDGIVGALQANVLQRDPDGQQLH